MLRLGLPCLIYSIVLLLHGLTAPRASKETLTKGLESKNDLHPKDFFHQ